MAAGAVAGGEHHRRHLAVAGVAAGADAERSLAAFAVNLELSRLLQAVAENPAAAGLSLLGFSFVYGVLHALGPGHGKIVITTWLATHPAKLKSSIGLTLAASLLQGLVAIALVVVVLALLQLPARQLHLSSFWLEKGSYLLVGALGLLLCWRALKKLRLLLRRPTFTAFTPHHVHNEHCGCGHQHLPAPEQLQAGDDWRARAPRSSCRWVCVPARGRSWFCCSAR